MHVSMTVHLRACSMGAALVASCSRIAATIYSSPLGLHSTARTWIWLWYLLRAKK